LSQNLYQVIVIYEHQVKKLEKTQKKEGKEEELKEKQTK
jgi:hypothetical protein